jgi:hypothetical protein
MWGPFHAAEPVLPFGLELCGAAAFAALCAGAALLRNRMARRLLDGPCRKP